MMSEDLFPKALPLWQSNQQFISYMVWPRKQSQCGKRQRARLQLCGSSDSISHLSPSALVAMDFKLLFGSLTYIVSWENEERKRSSD